MKNKFYFLTAVTLFSLFFLFSCEKENINVTKNVEINDFTVTEGMLVFEDETALQKVLTELTDKQDELDVWEKSIPNFTSMRTKFDTYINEDAEILIKNQQDHIFNFAIVNEGEEESIERNLYDDVLATLVNDEGYLQIGNKVHRFTYGDYYTVDKKDLALLQKLDLNQTNNSAISKTEIIRTFPEVDNGMASARKYTVRECVTTDGNRRVVGSIVREDVFRSNCIIKAKSQRRRFGVWWSNRTNITVRFSGNFVKVNGNCRPSPVDFSAGNRNRRRASSVSITVPINGPLVNCRGSVTPLHDGRFSSTFTSDGRTCVINL